MDRDDQILSYVTGRMSPEDAARFEAKMAGDADLRAEVTAMSAARAALTPDAVPSGQAWTRFQSALDAGAVSEPVYPASAANANRPIKVVLAQVAAIAVVAVALWQFVAVPTFAPSADGFRLAAAEADLSSLQVTFQPSATVQQITDTLLEIDGMIIDGPSALGLYRIGFASEEGRDIARAALTAQPEMIDTVMVE